ncbi:hypothetical protein PPSIR1_12483 [Plesiocystis pacifica SIR-1]|uniref:DUF1015 domain-containing protein n=1 Tax=Plesiocystis pacifica SIR-1 TaxID=391625 RepID=A6G001_9BACT|nr:DUF1015 domain-containing protein [Plesiocystis pacifica]EDM80698.1 hypothetical protein PPSIR1_12483 [Plesiocystis pacifica SIR-1]
MARIRAFQGLRYDLPRAGDPADLLAPPYDVVDDAGRAELAARSPHNCAHVILPVAAPGTEGEPLAKYKAGAAAFRKLIDEALVHDEEPSFYVYHQRFTSEGQTYVRKGFVGLIELTRFGQGPVLPHERTLSGPKRDRLELMRACDAHLELVFGMFADPARRWEAVLAPAMGEPVLEVEWDGVGHSLFRVSDPDACAALSAVLADENIYIADGHHRYETMCTFRDELEAAGRGEPAKWGMIYLSNLDDEGLVVLPTHRLVHGLEGVDLGAVVDAVRPYFDVEVQAMPSASADLREVLISTCAAANERATFGLTLPGSGELTVLTLREDFDPAAAGLGELVPALQRLDVALLHELVLERALGITKEAQAAKANLYYYKSTDKAVAVGRDGGEAAGAPEVQLVCYMNATPVRDVVAVCDSGEVMPQKSTFFFPKIPTGLVFRDIGRES